MAKNEKKAFFKEPTIGEINGYALSKEFSDHLIRNIFNLNVDERGLIEIKLMPKDRRIRLSNQFQKKGPTVSLPRIESLEETIKQFTTPNLLRQQSFRICS